MESAPTVADQVRERASNILLRRLRESDEAEAVLGDSEERLGLTTHDLRAIEAQRMPTQDVVRVLAEFEDRHGTPRRTKVENTGSMEWVQISGLPWATSEVKRAGGSAPAGADDSPA